MASRREFIRVSAAGLGVVGAPSVARPGGAMAGAPALIRQRGSGLRILILGGTGFTGPAQVAYATARGHKVSVFNRGRRQADLPAGVERLQGDRTTGDLRSLKGKTWDVVIDVPTTLPRWVRDAGEVLSRSAGRFVFFSTISVYGDPAAPPDESAPVDAWKKTGDPMDLRQMAPAYYEDYGALKALAEREAERWWPGKTTVVRPGLIVGPRDDIDRFTYWVQRVDRGGEILAPGAPTDPVQVIDARDLAEWVIRLAEGGVTGTYNATGPRARLSFSELLHGMRAAMPGDTDLRFTWVPADFLASQKVEPWSDMPLWMPPGSVSGNVSETRIGKAVAAGLTFRPLAVTVKDTLDWFRTLPPERRARLRAGVTPEREAEVLSAWKASGPAR